MEDVAKFVFVGTTVIALFAFMTVSHWVNTRAAERRDRERLALLRKVAEQPPATAALMRELLQEEDARTERRALQKARKARQDGMQGGVTVMATGVGLSGLLFAVSPDKPVWTVGIMLILIGIVIFGFAYASSPDDSRRDHGNAQAE